MGGPRHDGKRLGVVDVGSNTIKALVVAVGEGGALQVVGEAIREVRLAGSEAQLAAPAIAAGVAAVAELTAWAKARGAATVDIVATAAVRRAPNREEFCAAVRAAAGCAVRVLTGEEEARLIGLGLRQDPGLRGEPRLVQLDQGGGSLELIEHGPDGVVQAISLPLGAVRVTSTCVADPGAPLPEAVCEAVRIHARSVLAGAAFAWPAPPLPVVATGGGLMAVADLLAEQSAGGWLQREALAAAAAELASLPVAERIKRGISRGRADVLPAGLLVVDEVLRLAGASAMRVSRYNLRWGVAAATVAATDGPLR